MDLVSTAFYAVVCGLLALAAPRLPRLWARALVGAVVGVLAALVLPFLRGLMAPY